VIRVGGALQILTNQPVCTCHAPPLPRSPALPRIVARSWANKFVTKLSFRRPAWKLSRAFPEGAQPISTASPCNKIHAADAGCGGCTVAVAETGDEAIVGGSEGAEGQSGHRLSVSRKSLIETHCLRGLAKQCIHWKFNFEICRRKTRAARCYGCLCRALG